MQEQTIFTEAMEIANPAQRAGFLDRACGGDAALRERVEKLLQRHQQNDSFLESPAIAPANTGEYTPNAEAASLLGISARKANHVWAFARAWLREVLSD